jgi:acyl-CoA synthetase (AMP-forming)/AMP-acid ligase II
MSESAQTPPTLAEVEEKLLGPGAPFETTLETVLGEPMTVFKERPRSLAEILAGSRAHGDAEYLVCDGLRLSFGEHARRVAYLAQVLREEFGVGRGDRVAILAANGPEWIVSYWATVCLGAVAVGLNGWWAADEIRYGLEDCEPRLLIGDRRRLARVKDRPLGVPVVEIERDFEALWTGRGDAALPEVKVDEDDPATILYTSGTTGRPKGAVNTHRSIIGFIRTSLFHGTRLFLYAAARAAKAEVRPPPPCLLVNAPLFHVSGLYTGAVIPLATGVKTVWTRQRFDPGHVMGLIESERVTNWGPMGNMMYRLARHPDLPKYDLSSMQNVGSGGAPIGAELLRLMGDIFPNARSSMGVGYGLTESSSGVAMIFGEELEQHPGSVGRALPTVEFEIRDADGKPVAEGVEGEIFLRGPQVMKEYWRRPRETRETILPDRWLRTGDWGRLEDGYLYVNSRKRDLILRGAENVYPAEIENCLESHPDVQEAAVLGVDHAELGQEVKAVVVAVDGRSLEPEALRAWLAERLAYYKVPAHWELRELPLPRNAAGKVLKHVLRGEAENAFVPE